MNRLSIADAHRGDGKLSFCARIKNWPSFLSMQQAERSSALSLKMWKR